LHGWCMMLTVVEKFRTEDLAGLDAFDYLRWRQTNPAPYEHLS